VVTSTLAACTKKKPCTVTLLDLGSSKSTKVVTAKPATVGHATVLGKAIRVSIAAKKLPKGHRYLLVVRGPGQKHPLLLSTMGTVGS
jgi:hypothetical protein